LKAGLLKKWFANMPPKYPGVCLGQQAIGEVFGGTLT
jgi:anthranilate/para-aminobenzoate synthase component II